MVRMLVALPVLAICLAAAVARAEPPVAKAEGPDLLVLGDSQAQGVAGALERRYLRGKDFHIVDKSKIGSGLTPRSPFDWDAAIADLTAGVHARIAIVMFGANDRPSDRIKGVVDPALAEKFSRNYSARVEKIVKSLRDAKIEVVWLGDPVVKDADYNADMQMLNQVMEPAVEKGGAQWVSLWDLAVDPDGSYDAYGKGLDGQTKRLRADDGVHFTPSGYDLIAARIDPLLKSLSTAQPAAADTPPSVQPAAAITQ
jgi:uncharacterized protein